MKLKITLHGVAHHVDVEVLDAKDEMQNVNSKPANQPTPAVNSAAAAKNEEAPTTDGVISPIAGTVLEVKCKIGSQVTMGQTLLVIDAMKMETEIAAPGPGRIKTVLVASGDTVRENQVLVEFE